MDQNFHVNKTNFHMKGFALGLALKKRQKTTQKLPIHNYYIYLNIAYRIYSNRRPLSNKRLSPINAPSTHKNI